MTKEEMRIAVAEEMGWVRKPPASKLRLSSSPLAWWYHPLLHQEAVEKEFGYPDSYKLIPDYPNDLNAIHEAWLGLTIDEQFEFAGHLRTIVRRDFGPGSFDKLAMRIQLGLVNNAAAPQRCEAFLRVKGKWRGE